MLIVGLRKFGSGNIIFGKSNFTRSVANAAHFLLLDLRNHSVSCHAIQTVYHTWMTVKFIEVLLIRAR